MMGDSMFGWKKDVHIEPGMRVETLSRWGDTSWMIEGVVSIEGIAHVRLLPVDHARDSITIAVSALADKHRFRVHPMAVAAG
jgi:hypothetical protein